MNKIKLILLLLTIPLLGATCVGGGEQQAADGGVWKSADKGENWSHKVIVYADRTITKSIADVNVRKLVFSPGDTRKIFAITDQNGLWISWNGGNFWDVILPTSTVYDMAINPKDKKVIYVALNSSIVKTENEGDSWKAVYTSDKNDNLIYTIVISPSNSNIIYAGTSYGDIIISEDAGVSWRRHTKLSGVIQKLDFHPATSTMMYAGMKNGGLAQSLDSGKNWTFFKENLQSYKGAENFRDFVFLPTGLIYASSFGLLRTLNQGKDWTVLPLIVPDKESNIQSVAVNPQNPQEVYYATGAKSTFYKSVDGGFNWIPRSLPTSRAARTIIIDPIDPNIIYLGVGSNQPSK